MKHAGLLCVAAMLVGGCGKDRGLRLQYELVDIPSPVKLITTVRLSPGDSRKFVEPSTYHLIAPGIGYQVEQQPDGVRQMVITHDADLGFEFKKNFTLVLGPPEGADPVPALRINTQIFNDTERLAQVMDVPAVFSAGIINLKLVRGDLCGDAVCAEGQTCCAGKCVDMKSDAANCGACGTSCGDRGDACEDGQCTCAGGPGCKAGKACCGNGCFDLSMDRYNCGACGTSCHAGETCTSGQCDCAGQGACPGGAGAACCIDANGHGACSPSGSCVCGNGECQAPNVCCNGTECVNQDTNPAHCGGCNTPVPAGKTCYNGSFVCGSETTPCDDACCGDPAACINTNTSLLNCGACGTACNTRRENQCVGGDCFCGSQTCPQGDLCCPGSVCTDISSSQSCGGCNAPSCQLPATCNPTGEGFECQCGTTACGTGQQCCTVAGAAACVSINTDPTHCGGCAATPGCMTCALGHCTQCMLGYEPCPFPSNRCRLVNTMTAGTGAGGGSSNVSVEGDGCVELTGEVFPDVGDLPLAPD